MKERAYSCSRCGAVIVVAGPDSQIDAALRRVDWQRTGRIVTCRTCLAKSLDRLT
jgi:DNA-directed RNA polymerase subunit RPC12/RpoP